MRRLLGADLARIGLADLMVVIGVSGVRTVQNRVWPGSLASVAPGGMESEEY
jgi:hypothetical protein